MPGTNYAQGLFEALRSSSVFVLLLTQKSNESVHVLREVEYAFENNRPILPVLIEKVTPSISLKYLIGHLKWIDISDDHSPEGLEKVARALVSLAPHLNKSIVSAPKKLQTSETKGYVFLSYYRKDSDFVFKLRDILKRRGYAYWDYSESERDYHSALYLELEEKIENAKAFMSIITDSWRESEWPAAEYVYAKEAKVPIFVIQAKKLARPVPIIINLQTRIDMSVDFNGGAVLLEHELDKKGL